MTALSYSCTICSPWTKTGLINMSFIVTTDKDRSDRNRFHCDHRQRHFWSTHCDHRQRSDQHVFHCDHRQRQVWSTRVSLWPQTKTAIDQQVFHCDHSQRQQSINTCFTVTTDKDSNRSTAWRVLIPLPSGSTRLYGLRSWTAIVHPVLFKGFFVFDFHIIMWYYTDLTFSFIYVILDWSYNYHANNMY